MHEGKQRLLYLGSTLYYPNPNKHRASSGYQFVPNWTFTRGRYEIFFFLRWKSKKYHFLITLYTCQMYDVRKTAFSLLGFVVGNDKYNISPTTGVRDTAVTLQVEICHLSYPQRIS